MEVFLCIRQPYLKKSKRATGDLDFCPFFITAVFFLPTPIQRHQLLLGAGFYSGRAQLDTISCPTFPRSVPVKVQTKVMVVLLWAAEQQDLPSVSNTVCKGLESEVMLTCVTLVVEVLVQKPNRMTQSARRTCLMPFLLGGSWTGQVTESAVGLSR